MKMKPDQIAQLKACRDHFKNVLNDLESKSTRWDWAKFYDATHAEMKSTIDVLGAVIERVEGERKPQREIGYDDIPFHARF